MFVHVSLAQGRWYELSFMEQMGNIASETGRMVQWHGKDQKRFQHAHERALELIDLTRSDPRWHTFSRLKEISRLRELLNDAVLGGKEYGTRLGDLDRYVFQFAKAARLRT